MKVLNKNDEKNIKWDKKEHLFKKIRVKINIS